MYTEFVEKSKILKGKSIKKGHSNSENTELECPSFAIKNNSQYTIYGKIAQ